MKRKINSDGMWDGAHADLKDLEKERQFLLYMLSKNEAEIEKLLVKIERIRINYRQ